MRFIRRHPGVFVLALLVASCALFGARRTGYYVGAGCARVVGAGMDFGRGVVAPATPFPSRRQTS